MKAICQLQLGKCPQKLLMQKMREIGWPFCRKSADKVTASFEENDTYSLKLIEYK